MVMAKLSRRVLRIDAGNEELLAKATERSQEESAEASEQVSREAAFPLR